MAETLPAPWMTEACNIVEEKWPGTNQLLPHPDNDASIALCNPAGGYVVRMPRLLTEERMAAIDREVYLLEVLDTAPQMSSDPPIHIPKLLDFGVEWPYIVLSYVPGVVMPNPQLPHDDLCAIGEALAHFIYRLSNAVHTVYPDAFSLVPTDFPRRRQLTNLAMHWQPSKMQTPHFNELLYEILDNRYDFELPKDRPFFGHNDLSFRNITVRHTSEGWRLAGVFDFGVAQPSSPAQEMRYLYGMNPRAAEICAQQYERLSGERINRETMRLWGTAEYALRLRHILTHGSARHFFTQAKAGLERMYPQTDWAELDYAYSRTS